MLEALGVSRCAWGGIGFAVPGVPASGASAPSIAEEYKDEGRVSDVGHDSCAVCALICKCVGFCLQLWLWRASSRRSSNQGGVRDPGFPLSFPLAGLPMDLESLLIHLNLSVSLTLMNSQRVLSDNILCIRILIGDLPSAWDPKPSMQQITFLSAVQSLTFVRSALVSSPPPKCICNTPPPQHPVLAL